MPLNHQQYTAAHAPHTTPLKIIAGAGTGKTETLAARYVALVQQGVAPERILLLTFTEDAAAEMRARVLLHLDEAELALEPHALLNLWIATFHGFAMRLLHQHGFAVGLPPRPRLLADDDQQELWQAIRNQVEAEVELPNGYVPLDHHIYRWDSDETWNKVLAVIAAMRRGGGNLSELAPHPQLEAQQLLTFNPHRAQLVPLIEYCFAAYTVHLQHRGALDFDEQLQAALRLLRSTPTIRDWFDVVMIDEFQDTNRPQLGLLEELQPGFAQTTVVGDPRQAIYGWNSARAESIYHFPFRNGGDEYGLTENYRSEPAIVAVANAALDGSELGRLLALIPSPQRQRHRSPALHAEPIVSLHLQANVEHEARLIADEMQRLHAQGIAYRDMAVLMRSRTHLPILLAELQAVQVPYVLNGGSGFYLHWIVRLTSSLLRLLADPADRAAWVHLLESPLIGLPPSIITSTSSDQHQNDVSSLAFLRWIDEPTALPPQVPDRDEVLRRLELFGQFFSEARLRWSLLRPAAYLEWLWQASGLLQIAITDDDPHTSLVLQQLQRDADQYAAVHPAEGIAGFTAVLQRHVKEQPRVALPTLPTVEAVEVATVHQAKGREWPVVFVFNTTLPSMRAGQVESVLWDEQWQLVISDSSEAKASTDALHELRNDFRRRNRNEERSIWYVALTRAQERLYVLHSGCHLQNNSFVDAREMRARQQAEQAPDKHDETVHFFHELWEQLQSSQHVADGTIICRDQSTERDGV